MVQVADTEHHMEAAASDTEMDMAADTDIDMARGMPRKATCIIKKWSYQAKQLICIYLISINKNVLYIRIKHFFFFFECEFWMNICYFEHSL